jgi:hypothetical protein
MVCFETKNPILGKFWLIYFMVIWNILQPFGISYGHLVMLWQFSIFSLGLVYCVKKNLATLPPTAAPEKQITSALDPDALAAIKIAFGNAAPHVTFGDRCKPHLATPP